MIVRDVDPHDGSQLNVVAGPAPGVIRVMASPNSGLAGVWVDVYTVALIEAIHVASQESTVPTDLDRDRRTVRAHDCDVSPAGVHRCRVCHTTSVHAAPPLPCPGPRETPAEETPDVGSDL